MIAPPCVIFYNHKVPPFVSVLYHYWKRSICISDFMQTTFLYLGRFLKKLAAGHYSSKLKRLCTYIPLPQQWPLRRNLTFNGSIIICFICRYCVFTGTAMLYIYLFIPIPLKTMFQCMVQNFQNKLIPYTGHSMHLVLTLCLKSQQFKLHPYSRYLTLGNIPIYPKQYYLWSYDQSSFEIGLYFICSA